MSHLVLLLHFLYQLPTFLPTAGVVRGEDNKETLPSLHVLLSHYAQLLLPGGVEDVQQTDLTINNQLLPVAVLYGGLVVGQEIVLKELSDQGGLRKGKEILQEIVSKSFCAIFN